MTKVAIREISTIIRDQNPVTARPSATVREACQLMHDRSVGAVLVTEDDGKLVGIFTGRDAVGRVLAAGLDASSLTLGEVMTGKPDCLGVGRDAVEALHRMRDGGFRHLPIVEGERLVGVVSHGDFRGMEHSTFDEQTGLWERI